MKTIQRILLTWTMVMLTTIITMPNAYANDQAAIVIVAAGKVYAVDSNQTRRSLQRRSRVYVGDTLITGKKGRAQVRFIDGAVLSLRPDSELNIQKYSYGKTKSDEGSLMTLIKGGFRTITGAIGKKKYKVATHMATIGIRGTHYEAVIDNSQLYVALWDGGVTLSNNAGQIDLGLGADYNFGMVQGENVEPQGQLDPPDAITNGSQAISPDLSSAISNDEGSMIAGADGPTLDTKHEWMDPVDTMPTSGIANYINVASVSATGSTTGITNFNYNATVDFAAATIDGTLSFNSTGSSGSHSWALDFNGGPGTNSGVSGTDFSMNVDSSTSRVDDFDSVSGTISGSFEGGNAEQMVGSFNVVNDNDSAVTAEGTFTATQ